MEIDIVQQIAAMPGIICQSMMLSNIVPISGDMTTTSLPMMAAGNAKHSDFPPA